MPAFTGVAHVGLTVSNLDASIAWYQKVLDGQVVFQMGGPGESLRSAGLVTNGLLIALNQHAAAQPGDRFNETRTGLDHLSFACPNRAALEEWQARLDENGVTNSGINDTYAHVLVFRDPDNIQLEFFAPLEGQ